MTRKMTNFIKRNIDIIGQMFEGIHRHRSEKKVRSDVDVVVMSVWR